MVAGYSPGTFFLKRSENHLQWLNYDFPAGAIAMAVILISCFPDELSECKKNRYMFFYFELIFVFRRILRYQSQYSLSLLLLLPLLFQDLLYLFH